MRDKTILKARSSPNLHFISFSIQEILSDLKTRYFPDFDLPVSFNFVSSGSLACCIKTPDRNVFAIYTHEVLNRENTPYEVLAFICKHELLHHLIPPRKHNGKKTDHPPEFWEQERAISPERDDVWTWIMINFGSCIKRRPRLERIDVLNNWRKVWQNKKYSIPEAKRLITGRPIDIREINQYL